MGNHCYFVFFLYLCSFFVGYSQVNDNEYSFSTITTENGLSNNIIYDILEDREGYIWIATDNGINRYDGYTTKKFFHKTDDSTSISSSVIRSLIEDNDGNLWVGTKNGLNLYDKEKQHFKQFSGTLDSLFSNQEIMKMTLDGAGKVWISTLNDIGYFNTKTYALKSVYNSGQNLYSAISDEKTWFLSKDGELSYYDTNSRLIVSVVKETSLIDKTIYYGKYSKQLWLPSKLQENSALINYRIFPKLPNNLKANYFLEISENLLWIGSNKGLFEFDYALKKLKKINLSESTLVQQIRSIYQDKHGGVWVGTLGGAYHYDPHRKVFHHIDIVKDSDDIIMGLHANQNGVYANALGKALYYKPIDSSEFKKINLPKSFPDQGLFIWDIVTIPESNFPIWLATNQGVFCYDSVNSTYEKIEFSTINKDKNISFSILNTSENYVWISSYRAIHKVTKTNGALIASYSLNNFMEHSGIQKITLLGDYIFIATEGEGLLTFNIKNHQISKVPLRTKNKVQGTFKTPIWDLFVKDETLWIGTNQGLYNLDLEDIVIEPVLQDDQIIFSIVQDDDNLLWMGSDKGIKTYNPDSRLVNYYNVSDGLKNKEFNRKSVIRTSDGNFWFGGVNGITSFNPNKIKIDNPYEPSVHIKNIQVITSDTTFSALQQNQKSIVLPWEHNTIEITYVGINFTNPSQNKYKYKMNGYDPDWVERDEPSAVRYVKLPVGTYEFKIIASNNDGLWNTKGDNIEIKITPPIWRTKSAYLFYTLAIISLIGLFRRLKKYRTRIKEVELEKVQIAKKVEEIAIILNNKSKIYLDTLKYIKSDGNYLEFVTNNKTIIDRNKLKAILDDLPPNFIRTHRSYIINKNYIVSFNSTSVFINPNIEIPLSRTFKSNLT